VALADELDVRAITRVKYRQLTLVTDALDHAEDWVWPQVKVRMNGTAHAPAAIRDATALLAAVYIADPLALKDDSRIPNLVRLQILPWAS
jgi:hypothetical protein